MKLLLAILLTVTPHTIPCPFDSSYASFTGKTRQHDGATECQYKHIHFAYGGSLFTETPHVLWASCEVKE